MQVHLGQSSVHFQAVKSNCSLCQSNLTLHSTVQQGWGQGDAAFLTQRENCYIFIYVHLAEDGRRSKWRWFTSRQTKQTQSHSLKQLDLFWLKLQWEALEFSWSGIPGEFVTYTVQWRRKGYGQILHNRINHVDIVTSRISPNILLFWWS